MFECADTRASAAAGSYMRIWIRKGTGLLVQGGQRTQTRSETRSDSISASCIVFPWVCAISAIADRKLGSACLVTAV